VNRVLVLPLLAACNAGTPTVVTTALTRPKWLAQDTAFLYAVELGTDVYQLVRVPKRGGTGVVLAHDEIIPAVIADDAGVYWLGFDGLTAHVRTLVPGSATPFDLGQSTSTTVRNLALDAQAVYFADEAGSVWRAARDGSGASIVDATDTSAGALASGVSGVWVSTLHGAKLLGSPELAFAQQAPDVLAVDGDALFALTSGSGADGSIVRVSATGSPTTIASTLAMPTTIVARDGELYIATANAGAVQVLPELGGDAALLAQTHRGGPGALVVDATAVYWTETDLGEILEVPR
jgi:hypothetical protein